MIQDKKDRPVIWLMAGTGNPPNLMGNDNLAWKPPPIYARYGQLQSVPSSDTHCAFETLFCGLVIIFSCVFQPWEKLRTFKFNKPFRFRVSKICFPTIAALCFLKMYCHSSAVVPFPFAASSGFSSVHPVVISRIFSHFHSVLGIVLRFSFFFFVFFCF